MLDECSAFRARREPTAGDDFSLLPSSNFIPVLKRSKNQAAKPASKEQVALISADRMMIPLFDAYCQ